MSEFDYAFAFWLNHIRCTRGDVDRLLKDVRLGPLHRLLSFTTGKQWADRLDNLPAGIADGGFKVHDVSIRGDEEDAAPTKTKFVYRDVGNAVRYLIGHTPFKDEMQYQPIRLYRDETEEVRVYNELYSGDWWWDTQSKLPSGSTVVPILISVDKTLLTTLHGDTSCWPVYLSIGNLNRDVRRAHHRNGIVLIGFVPVVDCSKGSGREGAKFELYHTAMRQILRRKSSNHIATGEVVLYPVVQPARR